MGELEEIKNDIRELKEEIINLKKKIGTMERNHNSDMEFVNKEIDQIAARLDINLDASLCEPYIQGETEADNL